jgi:chorismate dehydratase
LAAGQVDLGLIPSIEYARSQMPYDIVPGLAIAAEGEALTVRLYYRGDLNSVRRVALDTSSRTSVALLRILLHERYGLQPLWLDAKPDLSAMLEVADAALLIGDSVFAELPNEVSSLDLGSEWFAHTALPFVFAFWAGRPGALGAEEVAALQAAKEAGLEHVGQIARDYAQKHGGDVDLYVRYLTQHIRFAMGEREVESLRLFYVKAQQLELIEAVPPLSFFAGENER